MKYKSFPLLHRLCVLIFGLFFSITSYSQAGFTILPASGEGCVPFVLNCFDTSNGGSGASSYTWSITGTGTPPAGSVDNPNPGFTFLNPGTYTVTQTINGGSSFSRNITVFALPEAEFVADVTSGCAPISVSFQDLSTSPSSTIESWEWDLGQPPIRTVQNPTEIYIDNNTFDIDLVVTDANGCQNVETKVDYIRSILPPEPTFSVTPSGSCETPFSPNVINTTLNEAGVDYNWSFSGAGVSPTSASTFDPDTITYTQNGNFDISLTTSIGVCTRDTTAVGAINIDELVADFTIDDDTPCQGQAVTFTDASTITGLIRQWYVNGNLVGGNTETYTGTYNAVGSRNICLVVSTIDGACQDSICKTIDVQTGPTVDFTADNTISCSAPLTANFTSTATGAISYAWTITPATASPSTSSAANPSFTFNNPGNYNVSLTVTSANGCERTITKNNYIEISDNIDVSIVSVPPGQTGGCAPYDATYNLNATLPVGVSITNVAWNAVGGSPAAGSGRPFSTTFNNTGDYTVEAVVSFNGGCSQQTLTTTVEVGDPPTLSINVTPLALCLNESVTATATSNIPETQFDWYFENFGGFVDGGEGLNSNVGYTYEDEWAQPFNINMIGDVNGCKDTITTQVDVNPPGAGFTWERLCGSRDQVTLTPDVAQAQFSDFVEWILVSGPGSPMSLGTFTNVNAATITVDLGSVDIFGIQLVVSSSFTTCTDSVTQIVNLLNATGNATVEPREICPGENVSFRDNTAGVLTWQWIYGDGDTSAVATSVSTFNHIYDETGVYNAQLVTRNNANCRDTTNYTITVGGGTAVINGNLGSCDNTFSTSFNTTGSNFPQGGVASANWTINTDAGPQTFIDDLNPGPVTYNAPGQYTIELTAFDAIGCSDDTTAVVLIGGVEADFTSDKTAICPGEVVQYRNTSLGGNLSFNWSFPGGIPATSTDPNPVVTYGSSGIFDVTLNVSSNIGSCSDTETKTTYIDVSGTGFDFVVDNDSANCPTLTSNFNIVPLPAPGEASSIHWYFELSDENPDFVPGDDLEGASFTNASNIYTVGGPDGDGYYDVALVIEINGGCRDSIYKDDLIFVGGQSGQFDFTPDTLCAPDQVTFTHLNVIRTDTILWDYGDGQTQNFTPGTNNIVITYDDPGVYEPVVLLKNEGCPPVRIDVISTTSERIYVSKLTANATVDEIFICDNGVLSFMDSTVIDSASTTGDFIANVLWDFGDGTTSNDDDPSHNYDGSVTGNLTVEYEVTTDFGCVDDTSFNVKVYDTPNGVVDPSVLVCRGASTTLSASGADNYIWEPSGLVINNTSPNPSTSELTDTTIFEVVMYNDTLVCADTQFVQVDVLRAINGVVGPDAQICAGDSVQLIAEAILFPDNAVITYSWFPPSGLSNPNIANPVASPNDDQIYTVTIGSANCDPDLANVNIEVDGTPFVDAGEDQIVSIGDIVDLTAFSPNIVEYFWTDSEGNFIDNSQTITTEPISQTEIYFVEVGSGGCSTIDSVTLLVLENCEEGIANVPNVFTPNGDGINDVVRIDAGLGVAAVGAFRIFNRWGEIVFESDEGFTAWDGTQNGQELDPGVYVYYIELICTNDSRSIRKGNITLLK